MAAGFTSFEIIHLNIKEVWRGMTDWDKAPLWMSGIETMSADGPTEVGTKLSFYTRGAERPSEIVACKDGQSVTLRSIQGSVVADYTYTLTEINAHTTKVTLQAVCEIRSFPLKLLGPVLSFAMKMTDQKQPQLLKKYLGG